MMNTERRILNILLVLCLTLGFACLVSVYLPQKLHRIAVLPAKANPPTAPKNIASIVEMPQPPSPAPVRDARPGTGIIARFTPEPEPGIPPDLAIGDPHGDEPTDAKARRGHAPSPPTPRRFRRSSLVSYNPAYPGGSKRQPNRRWLEVPEELKADVGFWRDVYSRYDSNQIIMHDTVHLDIIYRVLDVSRITGYPRLSEAERDAKIEEAVEEARDEIVAILEKLDEAPTARGFTDEQWRIRKMFRRISGGNKFKKASQRVRAQEGLRDKFAEGLKHSGRYLGEIEAVIESWGLPHELTRLIFVESMFNTKAHSSAGARGIWQIMRRTALHYGLELDSLVDERLDPIASTRAAAKLLLDNYEELGSWPLAINAYNAGRGRLKQAVQRLGTRNIATIIRRFKHRTYGFASRNFFPEFLAAYDVAENAEKHFGRIDYESPLRYEEVTLHYHISLPDVARTSGIPIETLAELNPAFSRGVLEGRILIPRGRQLRVQMDKGRRFLAVLSRSPKSRLGPLTHRVARGETLSSIARMYGVAADDIRRHNRRIGRRLRRGQRLTIPESE